MKLQKYRDEFRDAWKGASRKLSEKQVHDLRVAARRLSAALFLTEAAVERNRPCRTRRRIRRLMKRLGTLRDLQVQILLVKKWKTSEALRQFLKSLMTAEQREKKRVHEYMRAHQRKWLVRDAVKQIRKIPPATLSLRIGAAIAAQREEMEKAKADAARGDTKSLHAVRITARKLRYSLEAAGGASPSELASLRRLQTRLGHARDLQLLKEKFAEWRGES